MTHAPLQGAIGFDDDTGYAGMTDLRGWTIGGALVGLIHRPCDVHPHWYLSALLNGGRCAEARRAVVTGRDGEGEGEGGRMAFPTLEEAREWLIANDGLRHAFDLAPHAPMRRAA